MTPQTLNNFGYLLNDLTQDQLNPLKNAVNKIQQNFIDAEKVNKSLVGYIQHQYDLNEYKDHVASFIYEQVMIYETIYGYHKLVRNNKNTKERNIVLENLWVNFQKKGEYNPPHIHKGLFSFVIWLQLPYLIENEKQAIQEIDNNINTAGHFQFIYTNTLGHIHYHNIPADKNYEGKICFFPSEMTHQVFPFYTSDEYRISISGNISFETD